MGEMAEINLFKHSNDAVTLAPGTVLFAEGDAGDVMYAVVEGEVELLRGDDVLEVVSGGAIVGEMALLDDSPRSATARARSEARVVAVDRRNFTFLVQEHPTFALQVMRVMADRIRHANERR